MKTTFEKHPSPQKCLTVCSYSLYFENLIWKSIFDTLFANGRDVSYNLFLAGYFTLYWKNTFPTATSFDFQAILVILTSLRYEKDRFWLHIIILSCLYSFFLFFIQRSNHVIGKEHHEKYTIPSTFIES